MIQAGKLLYVEPDHSGSPRVLIDPQRDAVVWTWNLLAEAFGNREPSVDPDQDGQDQTFDLRFSGQIADDASGLSYNYFRDYDRVTGRYVQSDPIGLSGGSSTYGYALSSPLTGIDPFGLQTTTIEQFCLKYGAGACKEVGQLGPRLAPPALGSGIVASAWCFATGCITQGGRPKGLKGKQESIYDRYCEGQDDPCAALKSATKAAINDARNKQHNMLHDRKLYDYAFSTRNPTMTGTSTTWLGHAADLGGRISTIASMISLGISMGCDMSEEKQMAVELMVPDHPWGR